MFLVIILVFISLLPTLYSGYKLWKREDINLFDILILSYTLYFTLIPLVFGERDQAINLLSSIYFHYNVFLWMLLVINTIWTKYYVDRKHIINITSFIRRYVFSSQFSKPLLGLVIGVSIVAWGLHIHNSRLLAEIINQDYYTIRVYMSNHTSRFVFILNSIINLLQPFSFLLLISIMMNNILNGKRLHFVYWLLVIVYLTLYLINSRTELLGIILLSSLFYYTLFKEQIKWKKIFRLILFATILFGVVFPSVFVYRQAYKIVASEISSGASSTIIIPKFIEIYPETIDMANEKIASRAMGVFNSFVLPFTRDVDPTMGKLAGSAIVMAIPSILIPNVQKVGSQLQIEAILGQYNDLSDSILLFSKIEFGLCGMLLAAVFFLLFFMLWHRLSYFFIGISRIKHLALFSISSVFGISYTVDMAFDTLVIGVVHASFYFSILILIFMPMLILNRLPKIRLKWGKTNILN